jgi:hypothetical protein
LEEERVDGRPAGAEQRDRRRGCRRAPSLLQMEKRPERGEKRRDAAGGGGAAALPELQGRRWGQLSGSGGAGGTLGRGQNRHGRWG